MQKAAILLLDYFLTKLCQAQELDWTARVQVSLGAFLLWFQENYPDGNAALDEACAALGLGEEEAGKLPSLFATANTEVLTRLWPLAQFYHKPEPLQALASLQFNMVLRWRDGRILPITSPVVMTLPPGDKAKEFDVLFILDQQLQYFLEQVRLGGLDALHGEAEQFGDEHPYNFLMGTLLKVANPNTPDHDLIAIARHVRQPPLREYFTKYMRLLQQLYRCPISPQAQALLTQHTAPAAPPAPSQGGWDS